MLSLIRQTIDQVAREFLRRALYGSVVGAAVVWLLVSSAPWRAAGAAFAHADFAAAAFVGSLIESHSSQTGILPRSGVVVVTIDDRAYLEQFQGRSPLDRNVLASLMEGILDGAQGATLVVDLDVSPAIPPGAVYKADRLDRLISAHRDQIVLARPVGKDAGTVNWLAQLNASGCMRTGHAFLPQVFGLADFAHDYGDSLADVAAATVTGQPCKAELAPMASRLSRSASDPMTLAEPLVLTAQPGAGQLLEQLRPKVVVLGGTWGQEDLFTTPFGMRYGVHLHAAKIAGYLQGRTVAPAWAQVLLAILVAAIAVVVGRNTATALGTTKLSLVVRQPLNESSVSVQPTKALADIQANRSDAFWRGSFRRLLVAAAIGAFLMSVYVVSGAVQHIGKFWAPSMILVGFSCVSVVAAWVTQITACLQVERPILLSDARGPAQMIQGEFNEIEIKATTLPASLADEFIQPLKNLLQELRSSVGASHLSAGSPPQSSAVARSRVSWGAIALTLLHVLGRTVLPFCAFYYLISL